MSTAAEGSDGREEDFVQTVSACETPSDKSPGGRAGICSTSVPGSLISGEVTFNSALTASKL